MSFGLCPIWHRRRLNRAVLKQRPTFALTGVFNVIFHSFLTKESSLATVN